MQSCAFEFTFPPWDTLTEYKADSHFLRVVLASQVQGLCLLLHSFKDFGGDESDNLLSSHSPAVLASRATQTPLESEMRVAFLSVSASQHAKAFG